MCAVLSVYLPRARSFALFPPSSKRVESRPPRTRFLDDFRKHALRQGRVCCGRRIWKRIPPGGQAPGMPTCTVTGTDDQDAEQSPAGTPHAARSARTIHGARRLFAPHFPDIQHARPCRSAAAGYSGGSLLGGGRTSACVPPRKRSARARQPDQCAGRGACLVLGGGLHRSGSASYNTPIPRDERFHARQVCDRP